MGALAEIFFGNPLRRMANSWYDVYQHYEDFWRFRLNNPGVNYRHYLHRQGHKNHHYAQSRTDQADETNIGPSATDLF